MAEPLGSSSSTAGGDKQPPAPPPPPTARGGAAPRLVAGAAPAAEEARPLLAPLSGLVASVPRVVNFLGFKLDTRAFAGLVLLSGFWFGGAGLFFCFAAWLATPYLCADGGGGGGGGGGRRRQMTLRDLPRPVRR